LGGRARFALAVKGPRPIVVPAGFGIKAQLEGEEKPAVFETSTQLVAHPSLSRFHLYRPRWTPPIVQHDSEFTVVLEPGAAVTLKGGDRIMVGMPRADGGSFDHTQILVVEKTWQSFGSTFVKMKGGIQSLRSANENRVTGAQVALDSSLPRYESTLAAPSSSKSFSAYAMTSQPSSTQTIISMASSLPIAGIAQLAAGLGEPSLVSAPELKAWKLGGSFRHFGHNAPATRITVDTQGRAKETGVSYVRNLAAATGEPAVPAIAPRQFPLDGEVSAVIGGVTALVEANVDTADSGDNPRKRLLERTVAQVDRQSLAWGSHSGASTVLTLDKGLAVVEGGAYLQLADIRGITVHQVEGRSFRLQAAFTPIAAAAGADLDFYGTRADAGALEKRAVLLAGADGVLVSASVLEVVLSTDASASEAFHRVRLDRSFEYRQFIHDAPAITVYGNLVEATQGKTEDEMVLGDGDGRAVFQTFAIPKTPLTYLLDTTQVPADLPELQVRVDRLLWKCVPSLFNASKTDRVYIVREDSDGKSFVQFGDGKTGARLPSGRGNVVAHFRTGSGARGLLKADAKPQAVNRIPGFDAAFLLEPATGGAPPETEEVARVAAPGTMQSLGRIVSLADYEAEALAVPGVIKARASWTVVDSVPLVRITILTESRAPADAKAAADALRSAVRIRGTSRCPIMAIQGTRRQVSVNVAVGFDATWRSEDVRQAILEALGARNEETEGVDGSQGLFSWQRRNFGEGVHGSHVVAAVQNVPGVAWVRLNALEFARPSRIVMSRLQPGAMAIPIGPVPAIRRALPCDTDTILALSAQAVTLNLAEAEEGFTS
jgi:predicted phage baseplate assembly protein